MSDLNPGLRAANCASGVKPQELIKYKLSVDQSEVSRCLLCHECDADTVCPNKKPIGSILRSLYFENIRGAADRLGDASCLYCCAPCENACKLGKVKAPVHIKDIMLGLESDKKYHLPEKKLAEVDLSTDICGVKLENPFLLSSSVVASSYDMCARAFEAGWAGVSFKTICNFPQHEASPRFSTVHFHSNAFFGFKNIEQLSDHSPAQNMDIFRRLKADYPNKVIVASIMGRNEAEWAELAKLCQDNGADVIECNFSCPNMEDAALGVTIGQSRELVYRFTKAVKQAVTIPVLAKLTPNITDMTEIAKGAKDAGADGIAAINTINSITGVNIDTLVAEPEVHGTSIVGGYSGAAVKPIALRFLSDLNQCGELAGMHISGMGGIENWKDALEFLLMGAGSLQITTAVMQYGYRIIDDLLYGLSNYLQCKNIPAVGELVGKAATTVVAHNDVQRDTILFPVFEHEHCIGCGRCYISCMDGGHQAITRLPDGKPKLNGSKCVGCHLCRLVCPTGSITTAARRVTR